MTKEVKKPKFGEIAPVSKRRVGVKQIAKLSIASCCIAVCTCLGVIALGRGIERQPPKISVAPPFNAVGSAGKNITLSVVDTGSGLKHVVAYIRSAGKIEVVLEEMLDRIATYEREVKLDLSKMPIEDGDAELVVEATDDSIWKSKSILATPLILDRTQPTLDLLYVTSDLRIGETGLVVYRTKDKNLGKHGVKVGDRFYAGSMGSAIHSALAGNDVFATFFSVHEKSPIVLSSSDIGDNVELVSLPTAVRSLEGERRYPLLVGSPEVMEGFKGLVKDEADPDREVAGLSNRLLFDSLSKGVDRGYQVLASLADIRANRTPLELRAIAVRQIEPIRRWDAPPRLSVMRVKCAFGDEVVVENSKGTVWSGRFDGVLFEPINGALDVLLPLRGVVKFAEDLGVIGKTVLVDHGCGVTSVYYNLHSFAVDVGGVLEAGHKLGTMGATGFASGTQLGVMVLLHGYPVNPRQWLETGEFQRTVQLSIDQAQSKLLSIVQ